MEMDLAQRRGSLRKSHRTNGEGKDDDVDNNGYMQVSSTRLGENDSGMLMNWVDSLNTQLTSQQRTAVYGGCVFVGSVLLCEMAELGHAVHRLCALVVPLITIASAFYWFALYVRRSWSSTSTYILFCACFGGEFFGQSIWWQTTPATDGYITHPCLACAVLLAVSIASVFSTLDTSHSAFLLVFVSFVRFVACTSLPDLPQTSRPYVAYFAGVIGVMGAKYVETLLSLPVPSVNSCLLPNDNKLVLIKRRRSSSGTTHGFSSHRAGRRTSLPALMEKQQGSYASYEVALISEAHGLISDMLADTSLPLHVVSGLRAVSSLLKPDCPGGGAGGSHRQRISPLVSLSEANAYGSDNDDSPYTGERPSSLPKRLRRSLPPSLIRRMSTSTWTTTTSATGMPTLEPEPCRTRSSNFRHSRDNTPNTSPAHSRSPSPSSPTALVVPKSRSFSVAVPSATAGVVKKVTRERRSCFAEAPTGVERTDSPRDSQRENQTGQQKDGKDWLHGSLCKRLNITSDYESNDSPSSSDHSDNVAGTDDQSQLTDGNYLAVAKTEDKTCTKFAAPSSSLSEASWRLAGQYADTSAIDNAPSCSPGGTVSNELPFDVKQISSNPLLDIKALNEWDYPIFDLALKAPTCLLSMVAYRLFSEVGLFDTFRIPLVEFLNYFHALEMGYREMPYHNRVHATDVLHGVYYFTTQPIPGLQQVNIDSDLFQKPPSSSESDSDGENANCKVQNRSFIAEDTYGIMGGNFPALELMALYTAAAMHDYDHPGRTNAFLVATHAPLAVLYNDRSVLESHHAASVWCLFLSDSRHNWLVHLDKAEFKRFRFLVIEAILATDLKQHFELLAEFTAKAADEDSPGIDWTSETDRLMVANMVIKMADINGPCKRKDLHIQWTDRISEEFYEQGDEEANLGLQISPYMDRSRPQLAKLQESFINHLVAPLCNAISSAGLIPGTWVDDLSDNEELCDTDERILAIRDTEDETTDENMLKEDYTVKRKKVYCSLTENLQKNHESWVEKLKEEAELKDADAVQAEQQINSHAVGEMESVKLEMETITEEETPPSSANSMCDQSRSPPTSPDTQVKASVVQFKVNNDDAGSSRAAESSVCNAKQAKTAERRDKLGKSRDTETPTTTTTTAMRLRHTTNSHTQQSQHSGAVNTTTTTERRV